MYGTRDAPQIWQEEVEKAMRNLGFELSILHSSVFYHRIRNVIVVIHVDDFLCSGKIEDLQWLYESVKEKYDLKYTILSRDSKREVKYLNRTIRWTPRGVELDGDEKHVKILQKEWAMDQCSEVDTPITKNGQDSLQQWRGAA